MPARWACALQDRVCWQPRSRRRVSATVHLADNPPDGPGGGPHGLDRAAELANNLAYRRRVEPR